VHINCFIILKRGTSNINFLTQLLWHILVNFGSLLVIWANSMFSTTNFFLAFSFIVGCVFIVYLTMKLDNINVAYEQALIHDFCFSGN